MFEIQGTVIEKVEKYDTENTRYRINPVSSTGHGTTWQNRGKGKKEMRIKKIKLGTVVQIL